MNLSETKLSSKQSFLQEEGDIPAEPEYSGITMSWLRNAITVRSKVALLSAHKKHKAAVTIQSNLRRWKVRQKLLVWHLSANKIQKTWRGFLGRRRYFRLLENTLERRMIEHYNKSATRIQATFRGFHSRKYIHDQCRLKKLQLKAASELLRCVAIKTRELLKNQQLPGVYSLRNSVCLSKVDKLMASLRIKNYNEDCRKARNNEVQRLNKAFEKSIRSKDRTELPFGTANDGQHRGSLSLVENEKQPIYYKLVKHSKKPLVEGISMRYSDLSDLSFALYNRHKSLDLSE